MRKRRVRGESCDGAFVRFLDSFGFLAVGFVPALLCFALLLGFLTESSLPLLVFQCAVFSGEIMMTLIRMKQK